MDKKFTGFAVVAVLAFASCNAILNKDKAKSSTGTILAKTKTATAIDSLKVPVKTAPKDSTLKYVYLTFDDGPDAGTLNCYNTCKDKGVKASFFLIGEHANYRHGRAIIDTMKKDMRHFMFANHSYTHASHNRYVSFYKKPEAALEDFMRVHDSLHFEHPIARFPGNNAWVVDGKMRSSNLTKPLSKLMDSIGYNVMGWDVEWHFDSQSNPVQSAELMARQVINAVETKSTLVKNHVVILTHDRMFREQGYRDSLAKMITILQSKKGYVFETADQYPKLKQMPNTLIAARK
jgi:peptidoglycan-N-acetylglucosamine deacetylase